jgi:VIT1/CCC1 family predicted Fe2+/Mn2+ transporter
VRDPMGISDSATWKWRILVRFFGSMLLVAPFLLGMPVWNMAYAILSVMAGFLLVMIS